MFFPISKYQKVRLTHSISIGAEATVEGSSVGKFLGILQLRLTRLPIADKNQSAKQYRHGDWLTSEDFSSYHCESPHE